MYIYIYIYIDRYIDIRVYIYIYSYLCILFVSSHDFEIRAVDGLRKSIRTWDATLSFRRMRPFHASRRARNSVERLS